MSITTKFIPPGTSPPVQQLREGNSSELCENGSDFIPREMSECETIPLKEYSPFKQTILLCSLVYSDWHDLTQSTGIETSFYYESNMAMAFLLMQGK